MYQFIHIDLYAESVSKKAKTRRKEKSKNGSTSLLNVRQIIAEANRETGHHPHVIKPGKPLKLFGLDLDQVEKEAYNSKAGKNDPRGRKLRIDTPILLAGVISYPNELYQQDQNKFNKWLTDNQAWLTKEFGNNLKNITLHMDEPHPHIHFYAISKTGNAKDIHPGHLAAKKQPNPKAQSLAHKKAMRDFQDQYFEDISVRYGLQRTGPKRQRLSRAQYKNKKAEANQIAVLLDEIDNSYQQLSEQQKVHSSVISQEKATIISEANTEAMSIIDRANQRAKTLLEKTKAAIQSKLIKAAEVIKALQNEVANLQKKIEILTQENTDLKNTIRELKTKKHDSH